MAQFAGFLAALTPAESEALVATGRSRRYARDEYLMREGEPSHHVAVVRRGRVKVVKLSEDGHEALLAVEGPGELLGEISTLDGGPRTADVVALEPVEALLVAAPDFHRYLDEHQRVALVILRMVVGRLRQSDRWRAEFSQDASSRIARHLLDLMVEHGEEHGGGVRITVRLTHDELASMVGVPRETVSRALSHLRGRGLIATGRRSITVLDVPGLRERAEFA